MEKLVVADDLKNLITSMNSGTDRLQSSSFYSEFYSYAELAAMYSSWLGRRIVDLVPNEALKKGFTIKCPSWSEDKINSLYKFLDKLDFTRKLLSCLKAQRWAGGSIMVAILNSEYGAFSSKIPDFLEENTLLSVQPFDAWQAVPAMIEFENVLSKNYRLPKAYSIGTGTLFSTEKSGNTTPQGTLVDCSRVERFDGLEMPWYDRQRNMYWGQSVLASAYSAIRNSSLVDNSIATLLFRASVPVFKVHDLQTIVSDVESKKAFLDRVNVMNYGMSNNNMAIIDSEETLESFEPGAITNLDGVLERYYIIVSAATGIPVVKLVGESARGLNATGEGDLNNYYDMLEDYQKTTVLPSIMSMMKRWIVPSLFNELMPVDFEIEFPTLERLDDKEKQERDSAFLSMVRDAVDAGFIDKKTAIREIQQRGVFSSFSEDDVKRMESEQSVQEEELDNEMDSMDEKFDLIMKGDMKK